MSVHCVFLVSSCVASLFLSGGAIGSHTTRAALLKLLRQLGLVTENVPGPTLHLGVANLEEKILC